MENRIREIRTARGLTQEELGQVVGASKRTISGIERGETGVTLEVACKIADALGVSLDELAGRQPTCCGSSGYIDLATASKNVDGVLGEIVSRYSDMTDDGREMLAEQARMIAAVKKSKRKRKLKLPQVIIADDYRAIVCDEDNTSY